MDTGEWQAATFYSPVTMPWVSLGGSPTSPAALRVEKPPAQQRYRLGVRARRGRAGKEDTGAAASWLVGGLGVAALPPAAKSQARAMALMLEGWSASGGDE